MQLPRSFQSNVFSLFLQSFALKHPNYKTPKKEEDQYQFSFKLKDSVEKTISKKDKHKQKKNPVIAKKRHHSMPEVYSPITITQKENGDNLKFLDQEPLLCELLGSSDVPKNRTFTLEYFRQVHQEYIAKNGRQYVQAGYYDPHTSLLYGSS